MIKRDNLYESALQPKYVIQRVKKGLSSTENYNFTHHSTNIFKHSLTIYFTSIAVKMIGKIFAHTEPMFWLKL